MSERTEERERTRSRDSRSDPEFDTDVDIDGLLADTGGQSGTAATNSEESSESKRATRTGETGRGGFRARLRDRRHRLFSVRVFVGLLLGALGAGLLGGAIPIVGSLIGGFAGLLGVFVAAFVVGLASSQRYYMESGLAGACAAGITLLATTLTSLNVAFLPALSDAVPEIGVIGAGAGLLAALVGHYFGRDLREGLTADI